MLWSVCIRGLEAAARGFADALGALVALGMSDKQESMRECVNVFAFIAACDTHTREPSYQAHSPYRLFFCFLCAFLARANVVCLF